MVRTSLIQGLLKTIRENRSHPLPIRIFETSDVVVKDKTLERQARNIRKAAAVWCNKTAGFEVVHGLLDRLMGILDVPRLTAGDTKSEHGYYIKEVDDPTFFPGRAATIYYRPKATTKTDASLTTDPSINPLVGASASKQEASSTLPDLTSNDRATTEPKSTLANVKSTIKSAFGAGGGSGPASRDVNVGTLGILHPTVLQNFDIGYPCSALELDLELFKKEVVSVWEE